MFRFQEWTSHFLVNPGYNDVPGVITITKAPNALCRVLGVHKLSPVENEGKHNIYYDILDEEGERVYGQEMKWWWRGMREDERPDPVMIDKGEDEPGNIDMYPDQYITLDIEGAQASGFTINLPDEAAGNTWGHHSFYVVFQKGLPTDGPGPGVGEAQGFITIRMSLNYILKLTPDEQGMVQFIVPVYK